MSWLYNGLAGIIRAQLEPYIDIYKHFKILIHVNTSQTLIPYEKVASIPEAISGLKGVLIPVQCEHINDVKITTDNVH